MKQLLSLLVLLPILAQTQAVKTSNNENQDNGIKWTEGLSLEQVKAKAKAENKYIFLDIYATWCGPCKQMDTYVYSKDTVGVFFNDKFISVKVQTDKTNNDNEQVQRWYNDIATIQKQYRIKGYPTFIFLSPEGNWVHKETGFKPAHEFIKIAQTAILPGQMFIDPYENYYRLVEEYKQGRKDYSQMPYLRKKALELYEMDVAKAISKEYKEYLAGLKKEDLYTRENIEFLASTYIASTSPFFRLFYPESRRVDNLMNRKGFTSGIIDNTIQVEKVLPFFESIGFKPAGQIMGVELDSIEADWKKLYRSIRKQYNQSYAERNVLDAKLSWYQTKGNFPALAKCYLRRLDKYGLDTFHRGGPYTALRTNTYCWQIFMNLTDKEILKKAVKWMKEVVKFKASLPRSSVIIPMYLDTYANLLYKVGRKKEAIQWQTKAVEYSILNKYENTIKEYGDRLDKMKKGIPTWVVSAKINIQNQ